jgi:streptogramin lyase
MRNQTIAGWAAIVSALVLASTWAIHSTASDTSASDRQVNIREWDVPTKGSHPHDPAVGKDGALWFTEQMVNKLGRFDPATQNFKEYPLRSENAGPHGMVADREGKRASIRRR